MWPTVLLFIYCCLIALASLAGGWLPARLTLTHRRMQMMMSFVAGLMLGVAVLHLLPHALAMTAEIDMVAGWALVGLLATFFLMRWIPHFHQHETHASHEDDVACQHAEHGASAFSAHRMSWTGLFFGLALHTLIDGVALAASVAISLHEPEGLGLVGFATFLAILLHKPLDALSIVSLMVTAGWSRKWLHLVNTAFALMCPLGAILCFVGLRDAAAQTPLISGALGFAAGVFLCIALADILPEVQFHHHDRWKLSLALCLGVALAYGIGFVEPQHAHSRQAPQHEHTDHHH